MRAAVWHGGKDIRIEDLPKPTIGPDEALIKVKAEGICRSELHAYKGLCDLEKIVDAVKIPVRAVGGLWVEEAIESLQLGAKSVVMGAALAIAPDTFAIDQEFEVFSGM